jgi:hypothetical protein
LPAPEPGRSRLGPATDLEAAFSTLPDLEFTIDPEWTSKNLHRIQDYLAMTKDPAAVFSRTRFGVESSLTA